MAAVLKFMSLLSYHLYHETPMILTDHNNYDPDGETTGHFGTQTISVKSSDFASRRSLSINIVTPENVGSVPPFAESGFEIRSVQHFNAFQNGEFTLQQYHAMLKNMLLSKPQWAFTLSERQVMRIIIRELNERHFKSATLDVMGTTLVRVGNGNQGSKGLDIFVAKETEMHFDHPFEGGNVVRLWIPLDIIDNFHLALGNIGSVHDARCNLPFLEMDQNDPCYEAMCDQAHWYQTKVMGPETIILFRGYQVLHCSADLGEDYYTHDRVALIVDIAVDW